MKIPAGSFGVDMNALLNRMNRVTAKTYSGRIINDTKKKLIKLQNDMNKTINQTESEFNGKHSDLANLVNGNYKDVNKKILDNYNDLTNKQKKNVINLTDLANGNHEDAVNQINQTWGVLKGTTVTVGNQKIKINNASDILKASQLEGQKLGNDMTEQIQDIRQGNKDMLNNQITPYVQKAFNEAINTIPATNTYYYPSGDSWPEDPVHGDLCWKSDWDDASGNYVNATLYEYYSGQGWVKQKTGNPSFYAANINGASLKGGVITGATYESSGHDTSGHANFSVNAEGRLYAHNLVSDLMHTVNNDQVNPCVYYGFLDGGTAPDSGVEVPPSGFSLTNGILSMKALVAQTNGQYNWDYQNHMTGQSLLEPGYLKLRYNGDLGYIRTDLRAGMLEIAADTWNQNRGARLGYLDGPNGQSPATLWLDGWYINEAHSGSDNLWIRNQANKGMIQLDAPTNITGSLLVDNNVKIKGKDVNNRFENAENRLSGHDTTLQGHNDRLDRHRKELNDHQNWLKHHDDVFNQHGQKLSGVAKSLSDDGDILTKHGRLLDADGNELDDHKLKLSKHGDLLNSHGQKLSNHEQRLLEHRSRLDKHNDHLKGHDDRLDRHRSELNSHQQWLKNHDDLFNQRGKKLDGFTQSLADDGDILTKHGRLLDADGNRLDNHKLKLSKHGDLLNAHGNKLSDHEQRLIEHKSRLDKHNDHLSNHDGRLDRHRSELDDHEQWMKVHDNIFTDHGQKLGGVAKTLSDDGDILTKHGRLLDADGNRLDDHKLKLSKHGDLLNSHGNKLSNHEQRLIEHKSRLDAHNNHLSSHDSELSNHKGRLDNDDNRLNQHEQWLYSHNDQFDKHKQKLDSLTSSLDADGDTLTNDGKLLDAHGNELSSHTYTLGQHGNLLNSHGDKLSDHETRLINHKSRLDSDDTTLQTHANWLSNHDDLFKKHGQKLDSFSQDLNSKGTILTNQGNLIGSNGNRITDQQYTLNSHGDILNQHGDHLSKHDQSLIYHQSQLDDKQNQLNSHQGTLTDHQNQINDKQNQINGISNELGNYWQVTRGQGGDVSFGNTGGGHFTFHSDLSVLENHSLFVGGVNNAYGTQIGPSTINTQNVDTTNVTLGNSVTLNTQYGHSLRVNGRNVLCEGDVNTNPTIPQNLNINDVNTNTVTLPNVTLGSSYDGSLLAGGKEVFTWSDLNGIEFQGDGIYSDHGGSWGDHCVYFNDGSSPVDIRAGTIYSHGQAITDGNGNIIGSGGISDTDVINILNSNPTGFAYRWQVNTGGGTDTAGIKFQGDAIYSDHFDGCVYFNNGAPVDVRAGDFYSHGNYIGSARSIKKDIASVNPHDALAKVLNTDIKSWRYNTDNDTTEKHIGPVIDDLNSNQNQKYYTPNELIKNPKSNEDSASFSLNNALSYLFLSVQELQKQNSQLSQRIAKLEFENKQ